MHKVLFMLHGIGKYDANWGDAVEKQLKAIANSLTDDPDTGFVKQKLVDALNEVHFVSLVYDDLYQQMVESWRKEGKDILKELPAGAMERVQSIIGSKAKAADFVKDNLTDILIYYTMDEPRQFTRNHIALQIEKTIRQYGIGSNQARYFLLAHSMGTVVAHDTLAQISTTSGSPLLGGIFKFDALFQLSNTSALLKKEYDPRTSTVRLYNDTSYPNCVSNYVDVAHKWDPVCQVLPYQEYMKNTVNLHLYQFLTVKKILALNVHAIEHYLQFPSTYMMIFRMLIGDLAVPYDYFVKKSMEEPVSQVQDHIVQSVKSITEGHLNEPLSNLEKLIAILAEFAKLGVKI